jgi:hypothetical protein
MVALGSGAAGSEIRSERARVVRSGIENLPLPSNDADIVFRP